MKIKTKDNETFNVHITSLMNVSTTKNPRYVPCYVVKVDKYIREIPQENVVEIELENGDVFRKVE